MPEKRTRRIAIGLLGLLAVIAIVVVGLLAVLPARDGLTLLESLYLRLWLAGQERALASPAGPDNTLRIFIVEPGDTAATIGRNLALAGLIADAELFRNYARYHGLDAHLEAGTYLLRQTDTIPVIARTLTDSSKASVPVTILEGWRREEIADAIDANPLLRFSGADFLGVTGPGADLTPGFAALVDLPAGASLEGFLYPETYFVPPDATAADFRDALLDMFVARAGADLSVAAETSGLSLYQAVTLASIIQREAVKADEQPLIASVYHNRLAAGMTLDADPTVQYAIGYRDGSWWPPITQEDYRTALSPYNTYLNPGLPPGPIASPPRPAIEAAIFPTRSDYYYFRADCAGSGYHVFARTYEEHIANGMCGN